MSLIITERGSIWAADQRKRSGDAGTAAEPVLLLVHGAGGTHLVWNAPIRRLPNVGIVAPDLPGHGKSPEPSRDTVKAYADDMIALMDAMAIDRACILGYSLGGAIALQMALDHPQRVCGLILVGAAGQMRVSRVILQGLIDEAAKIVTLLADWMTTPEDSEAIRKAAYNGIVATPPNVMLDDFNASNTFDLMARLGEISTPALVLHGTADRMIPLRDGEAMAAALPNATLVKMEGVGHLPMSESPEAMANAINAWLTVQASGGMRDDMG